MGLSLKSTLQKLRVGITFSNLPNFLNGDNGDEKLAIIRTGDFKYALIGVIYQTQETVFYQDIQTLRRD